MGRIRTVKPEFWTHPIMGRLSDAAKWIAVALLNHADDEGFFRADSAIVRGAVAPFVDDSTIIRRSLDECSRAGWIELREHETEGWIGRIVNFQKHQRVDRPKQSTIKQYWQFDEASTIIRRSLDDQSTLEGKGMEGKGKERKERCTREPRVRSEGLTLEQSIAFGTFWLAYPRKVAKPEAIRAWKRVKPNADLLRIILAALAAHKLRWTDPKYIPHPATWINQRRWEDVEHTGPPITEFQQRLKKAIAAEEARSANNGSESEEAPE